MRVRVSLDATTRSSQPRGRHWRREKEDFARHLRETRFSETFSSRSRSFPPKNRDRSELRRVRADLVAKPDTLMAWEPIALETFGALPPAIRSGWVFILRAGSDTGTERHPNSHQRMMSFEATGDLKTDAKAVENEVETESE